jgi:hypothetical protein
MAAPLCGCSPAAACVSRVAQTDANRGRAFWACAARACRAFAWSDGGDDVQGDATPGGSSSARGGGSGGGGSARAAPACDCGERSARRVARTDANLGRAFWACAGGGGVTCRFFEWAESPQAAAAAAAAASPAATVPSSPLPHAAPTPRSSLRCARCRAAVTLRVVSAANEKGNGGRSYYKCDGGGAAHAPSCGHFAWLSSAAASPLRADAPAESNSVEPVLEEATRRALQALCDAAAAAGAGEAAPLGGGAAHVVGAWHVRDATRSACYAAFRDAAAGAGGSSGDAATEAAAEATDALGLAPLAPHAETLLLLRCASAEDVLPLLFGRQDAPLRRCSGSVVLGGGARSVRFQNEAAAAADDGAPPFDGDDDAWRGADATHPLHALHRRLYSRVLHHAGAGVRYALLARAVLRAGGAAGGAAGGMLEAEPAGVVFEYLLALQPSSEETQQQHAYADDDDALLAASLRGCLLSRQHSSSSAAPSPTPSCASPSPSLYALPLFAPATAPRAYAYDVFLSYRHEDRAMVDLIEDKLSHRECNLRVFRDVRGDMGGADFDLELLRAMARSAVIVPIMTLGAMRRLCTLEAERVDITCAEYCLALYLYDRGVVAGFYPIMVGEAGVEPASGKTVLDNLFGNATFKVLRDKLPSGAPPAATWRFVAATLAAVGEALPAGWERMTVRDVICGSPRVAGAAAGGGGGSCIVGSGGGGDKHNSRGAGAGCALTSGLFMKDCYVLEGDRDKLRTCLMHEFAVKLRRRIDAAAEEDAAALAAGGRGGDAVAASWAPLLQSRPGSSAATGAPLATSASAPAASTQSSPRGGTPEPSAAGVGRTRSAE